MGTGGLVPAGLQQLIPHGTKSRLASADVGPAILIRIPPGFFNLAGKLKANVGAARGSALGCNGNGYCYGYGYGYPVVEIWIFM